MLNRQITHFLRRLPTKDVVVICRIFHFTSTSILIYCVFLSAICAGIAGAATFTVNSGYDVNDLEPGNGLCVAYLVINPPFVIPFCTLRAAIEETNALPGKDIIVLGSGTYRISLDGIAEDSAATGDLDITDSLQIIGAGADKTFIDADGVDRVFDIHGKKTTVSLLRLSVINGELPAGLDSEQKGGGGIRNRGLLSLNTVVVANNTVLGIAKGDGGGGLFNKGTSSITKSTLRDNSAGEGGGVLNDSLSRLVIDASTIHDNSSRSGGGLMNYGSADLVNTTLSDNAVNGGTVPFGGAVWNRNQLQLVQCTIAENSADRGGGLCNDGTVSVVNTLLSANAGGNCCLGDEVVSLGYNLDSDNTCGLTSMDLKNIDARLGPLRDNGGPTPTCAIHLESPALDAGSDLGYISIDQRGITRPQRKAFDIGAFEMVEFSIVPMVMPLLLNQ